METYGFFSKEVALKLDINASTLRQWCLSIEEEGYTFNRNEKSQRIFYERDINLLFEIKARIQKTRDRDNAIKSVVSRFLLENNAQNTLSVHEEKRDNITSVDLQKLMKHIERQEQFNKELLERLDKQQQYIDERLNERDQTLMQSIREIQETNKQLAAAEEEKKKVKGFWGNLFKK